MYFLKNIIKRKNPCLVLKALDMSYGFGFDISNIDNVIFI